MRTKALKVTSIITIVWGILMIIGGLLIFLLSKSFSDSLTSIADWPFGAFSFIIGGAIWLVIVFFAAYMVVTGILGIVSGIFGLTAANKRKKWAAITDIVFSSIITIPLIPSIFTADIVSLLFITLPILNIVFCGIFLSDMKKQKQISETYLCGEQE